MQNTNQGGFCPNCGKQYTAGTAFCSGCGSKLSQPAPQPAPQPQYVAPQPQPQYVAPQPQYVAPQPQPQYVAPQPQYVAPQPQYVAPQPQPQPQYVAPQQPMYNTQTVRTVAPQKKPLWQTIASILLLVSVLFCLIFPFAGFSTYKYTLDASVDSEIQDYVKEANEEMEAVSLIEILTDDGYSISDIFDDFSEEMDYIDMMSEYIEADYFTTLMLNAIFGLIVRLVVYVLTLVFLIFMIVYSIKAIIAMCKGQYDTLVKCALGAFIRLISTFICFTIYTSMYADYADEDVMVRGGMVMAPAASFALYASFALIIGAIVIGMIMNKNIALSAPKKAGTIKNLAAFAGLSIMAFTMLGQKAQYLFRATYGVMYPNAMEDDDAALKALLIVGTFIVYIIAASMVTRAIASTGKEDLYFANYSQAEIDAGKMKRAGSPNILATAIFFLLMTVAVYVYESEFEFFMYRPIAMVLLTVLAIVVYVAYRVLGSVFAPKQAPQQQMYTGTTLM